MLIRTQDKINLCKIFDNIPLFFNVLVYDSWVNSSTHDASDLDLVLRMPNSQAIPFDEYCELLGKIKNSTIPILIELRDWTNLATSFHQQIETLHYVLYSKNTTL